MELNEFQLIASQVPGRNYQIIAVNEANPVRRWRQVCVYPKIILVQTDYFTTTITTTESEPVPELVSQLSQEIFQSDLLYHLIQNIAKFEFEVSSYS
jgi:hypothetical protein